MFHQWHMWLIQVFQQLIKLNYSTKQCQILEVSVLCLHSQRILSTVVWSEGTTWLSADFVHVLRPRLSHMFKTQKLYHMIKKRVIYKTLLPANLPMCSHRIRGVYFYRYKFCTKVYVWTWYLDFPSWTLSPSLDNRAGRRDKSNENRKHTYMDI